MKIKKYNNKRLKLIFILTFNLFYLNNTVAVEFDSNLIKNNVDKNIDLSAFEQEDYILPGNYLLNINLNKMQLFNWEIEYREQDDIKSVTPCLPPALVNNLPLTKEAKKFLYLTENASCVDLLAIPGTSIDKRINRGILNITIPKIFLTHHDPNWIPIERWDHGIAGLMLDYSLTSYWNKANDATLSSYGKIGFNWDAWRFRSSYNFNYHMLNNIINNAPHAFTGAWHDFYFFRPLPHQAADLFLGQLNINNRTLEDGGSLPFVGIALNNQSAMLPPSRRGYSPEVRGVANSYAIVSLQRDNRVFYETTVPPGPFVLRDLPNYFTGKFTVVLTEQDGTKRSWQVTGFSAYNLARPGTLNYNVALGLLRNNNAYKDLIMSGDFQLGIANNWTLGFSGIGTTQGDAIVGVNSVHDFNQFGNLYFTMKSALLSALSSPSILGQSYNATYNTTIPIVNAGLLLSAAHFTKNYRPFSTITSTEPSSLPLQQSKQRVQNEYKIKLNKSFFNEHNWLKFNVNTAYRYTTNWSNTTQQWYDINLSKSMNIKELLDLSINVNATKSLSEKKCSNNDSCLYYSLSVNLAIPLSPYNNASYATSYNEQGRGNHSIRYSGRDKDGARNWSLGAQGLATSTPTLNGNYSENTPFGSMSLSPYITSNNASLRAQLNGGFTITKHGFAFHRSSDLTSPRFLLDTNGVSNISLNQNQAKSNLFGFAVLPSVTSYSKSKAKIDMNKLPPEVEVNDAIIEKVLTAGAIGYHRFKVKSGKQVLATITMPDGTAPPFGALIFDENSEEIATISDNGLAYLAGIKPASKLTISWKGKKQCELVLPAKMENLDNINLICSVVNNK